MLKRKVYKKRKNTMVDRGRTKYLKLLKYVILSNSLSFNKMRIFLNRLTKS